MTDQIAAQRPNALPAEWRAAIWAMAFNLAALVASLALVGSSIYWYGYSNGELWEGLVLGWFYPGLPIAGGLVLLFGALGYVTRRLRVSTGAALMLLVVSFIITFGASLIGAAWGAGLIG